MVITGGFETVVPSDGVIVTFVRFTLGAIAMDRGFGGDVALALSLTVTLKVKGLPVVLDGIPAITPVEAFSVRPLGSDPAPTVQLL
jgi:hypothetical protein